MTGVGSIPINDVRALIPDFRRHLRAINKADLTIEGYVTSAEIYVRFAVTNGLPTAVDAIHRDHLEHYLVALSERTHLRSDKPISPAYVAKQYRHLRQFWKWLHDEGEITDNPFAKMSPPDVPEKPVPVVPMAALRTLLDQCKGNDFINRRDMALLRVFMEVGPRAGEVAGMEIGEDKLDFEQDVAWVMGKGRKPRALPFGAKTGEALRRYLRKRAAHPHAASPFLWLGRSGPLTYSGIRAILNRRVTAAGLPHMHPHQLRHTFAHMWMASGGSESDLMRLMGWKSREMVNRYGASAADERARASHRSRALGDRI